MKRIEHITWDHTDNENSQEHTTCVVCNILTEPRIFSCAEDVYIRCGTCPRCGITFIHPNDVHKATQLLINQ